jgi:hypothetical protein
VIRIITVAQGRESYRDYFRSIYAMPQSSEPSLVPIIIVTIHDLEMFKINHSQYETQRNLYRPAANDYKKEPTMLD